jgi:hypothetical protein
VSGIVSFFDDRQQKATISQAHPPIMYIPEKDKPLSGFMAAIRQLLFH